jgi:hypothetical protein
MARALPLIYLCAGPGNNCQAGAVHRSCIARPYRRIRCRSITRTRRSSPSGIYDRQRCAARHTVIRHCAPALRSPCRCRFLVNMDRRECKASAAAILGTVHPFFLVHLHPIFLTDSGSWTATSGSVLCYTISCICQSTNTYPDSYVSISLVILSQTAYCISNCVLHLFATQHLLYLLHLSFRLYVLISALIFALGYFREGLMSSFV